MDNTARFTEYVLPPLVRERLEFIRNLEEGWDGYDESSKPFKKEHLTWLATFFENFSPPPRLYPVEDDTISAEWGDFDQGVEVDFLFEENTAKVAELDLVHCTSTSRKFCLDDVEKLKRHLQEILNHERFH